MKIRTFSFGSFLVHFPNNYLGQTSPAEDISPENLLPSELIVIVRGLGGAASGGPSGARAHPETLEKYFPLLLQL